MNGVNICRLGNPQDGVDIKIGSDRAVCADQRIGFARLEPLKREAVLLGVNPHRLDDEFRRCPKNADGDFGSVGNK